MTLPSNVAFSRPKAERVTLGVGLDSLMRVGRIDQTALAGLTGMTRVRINGIISATRSATDAELAVIAKHVPGFTALLDRLLPGRTR